MADFCPEKTNVGGILQAHRWKGFYPEPREVCLLASGEH